MAPLNFALIGAAGFVAPRHMRAIAATGNRLVAAMDPHDALGRLDEWSFDVAAFTEIGEFERHLESLRLGRPEDRVHYVAVCSPNDFHHDHVRLALRSGADVICEKPLVVDPAHLDALAALEAESGRRVWTVLQLRLQPELVELKQRLCEAAAGARHDVRLTYVAARGPWYDVSWKGSSMRSGGVVVNIGIHLFDLVLWLFGSVRRCEVHVAEPRRSAGHLDLERADVSWFLSTDPADLPDDDAARLRRSHRSILVDGSPLEFSNGLSDLHSAVYAATLTGSGFGIENARPSIELCRRIQTSAVRRAPDREHPSVRRQRG